jgi:hypothetical protein
MKGMESCCSLLLRKQENRTPPPPPPGPRTLSRTFQRDRQIQEGGVDSSYRDTPSMFGWRALDMVLGNVNFADVLHCHFLFGPAKINVIASQHNLITKKCFFNNVFQLPTRTPPPPTSVQTSQARWVGVRIQCYWAYCIILLLYDVTYVHNLITKKCRFLPTSEKNIR